MRVVIADDAVLLREGLVRLLTESGHEVVAAVGDGPALVEAMVTHRPDVSIVDVRMPPTHTDEGLRAAVEARTRGPAYADPGALAVRRGVVRRRPARHGRTGGARRRRRLPAQGPGGRDRGVPRRAARGSPTAARCSTPRWWPSCSYAAAATTRSGELTPREREVLGLMAEGRSNTAIARTLVVTDGAVEKHVRNIFTKLGLPPDDEQHRRVLAVLTYLRSPSS